MPDREGPCDLKGRLIVAAAAVIGPLWLRSRRRLYRKNARPLTDRERDRLAGYFPQDLLNSVRVALVPRIADPWIFRLVRRLRIAKPSSLETMAGMAIIDTVVIAGGHRLARGPEHAASTVLIFHELVHVVQFRLLGPRAMVRRYIRGWVGCGYDYWSIPMEEDAYELHDRFARSHGAVFSAEEEVRRRLGL